MGAAMHAHLVGDGLITDCKHIATNATYKRSQSAQQSKSHLDVVACSKLVHRSDILQRACMPLVRRDCTAGIPAQWTCEAMQCQQARQVHMPCMVLAAL